jgi:hypothetical protein
MKYYTTPLEKAFLVATAVGWAVVIVIVAAWLL